MLASQNATKLVAGFEGCVLHAYPDPGTGADPWTIGFGHTHGVRQGDVITQAQAEAFLGADLATVAAQLSRLITVTVGQNQFDALVSLAYNVGINGFPTLLVFVNRGDFVSAKAHFGAYVRAGGKVMQGLINRRAKEAALFGTPDSQVSA